MDRNDDVIAHLKAALLDELFEETTEFESDGHISGADFVEWFAVWREEAKRQLPNE